MILDTRVDDSFIYAKIRLKTVAIGKNAPKCLANNSIARSKIHRPSKT